MAAFSYGLPTLGAVLRRLTAGRGGTLASLLDQALVSGFGFLTGIATARLVGIEEFGVFALVLIVTAFAQGLHNALVTAPMMTLAGTRRQVPDAYYASLLTGALCLSALAGIGVAAMLGALFAARADPVPLALVAAAAGLTLAQNMQFTLRRMAFSQGRSGQALAMDLARPVLFVVLLGAAWLSGARLTAGLLLWLLAASALATTVPLALSVWRAGGRRQYLGAVARRHLRFARWLFPVVFVTFGQEQVVWILVGVALGDEVLGGLRAAQYLVGLVLLLLAATENTVPTAAGRAFAAGGTPALRRYLLKVTLGLGGLVAVLLVAIAAPAGLWLGIVFGRDFAPYAGCAQVLAVGVGLSFLRDMAGHHFRATHRPEVIFQAFVASLVVSLAVLYPLLAGFGVIGAALVIAVGHATSMVYLVIAVMRARTLPGQPRLADDEGRRPC